MSYLINRRYVSPLMVNFYEGESTLVFVNASFGENALSTVVLKVRFLIHFCCSIT